MYSGQLSGDKLTSGLTRLTAGPMLYAICTVVSIILFAMALYSDDILNDDGMRYIYAAYEFLNGDIAKAKSFRPETFFYGQIGTVSKYSGLSLIQSAHTLSLLSQIILMCGFAAVLRVLGASSIIQILGIMVIASMVHFNELRPHIIRGFAFWACQIWALWGIISFAIDGRWRYLLLWLTLSSIAVLYRTEGAVYFAGIAALIPFIVSGIARKRFLICAITLLASVLIIGSASQLFMDRTDNGKSFVQIRIKQELDQAKQIGENLDRQKELIRATMPNKWARDSTSHFLIGGLLFEVIKMLVYTSNTLLLLIAISFGNVKLIPKETSHQLIAGYFALGIVVSLYVVASRFFVADRYIFFPSLLLCIPIPFLLNRILLHKPPPDKTHFRKSRRHQTSRLLLRAAIFIIAGLAILMPIIYNNDDKLYIRQAATWVGENLSPSASIYYNDQKLAFYSHDYSNQSFEMEDVSLEKLHQSGYRFAVIHSKELDPFKSGGPTDDQDKLELMHREVGPKNYNVSIYHIPTTLDLAPAD